MELPDDYLMYTATALYFSCYVPILYADVKNRNANLNNLPERVLSLIAGMFAVIYSTRIHSIPLMVNYIPHVILESFVLVIKIVYVYHNGCSTETEPRIISETSSPFQVNRSVSNRDGDIDYV